MRIVGKGLVCGTLALAGCVSTPPHTMLAAATPPFDPMSFFEGRTIGEGTLAIDLSGHRHTHVVGQGHTKGGELVLVQRVTLGNKEPETRTWHIRRRDAEHYTGTLSDATGPVNIVVDGNRLTIRFTMKHGLKATQWLYLQPGSTVALNRMVVKKFGLPIASLRERIVKQPDA